MSLTSLLLETVVANPITLLVIALKLVSKSVILAAESSLLAFKDLMTAFRCSFSRSKRTLISLRREIGKKDGSHVQARVDIG